MKPALWNMCDYLTQVTTIVIINNQCSFWEKGMQLSGRGFALHVKGPGFETQLPHYFENMSGVLLKNNNKDE